MIGPSHLPGDRLHGLEIARRGDGEAGLDHVDAEVLERLGDLQLFGRGSCSHPGDCSPSRSVVSKMIRRSSDMLVLRSNEKSPGTFRSQGRCQQSFTSTS